MTTTVSPTSRRVAVISLGCAKNLVDTEVMCGGLATSGFVLTDRLEDADILLINTCAFVADARSEADAEIRQGLQWKRGRKGRRLVVAGCLPQRDLAAVRSRYDGVDLFLGLDDVPRIASLLSGALQPRRPLEETTGFETSRFLYDHTQPRLQLTPANFAYVKIAEGCDHACRFCAIPAIRGRQRSRSEESIVAEVRMLIEQGVREVNLIAQDTTRYGHDRADGATIESLLTQCDQLPGDYWLRLLYTHPRHVSEDLIAVFARGRHLVPYIDIPLQHISDRMLAAMGRGMNSRRTRDLLDTLRERIPGVIVRSTMLVGYPGETDADFRELLEYVRAYRFDRLGVFVFSPEEGTPAAELRNDFVPAPVAEERQGQLLEVQREVSARSNAALIGRNVRVLIEGRGTDGEWLGRTAADAPDVDNCVHVSGPGQCFDAGFCDVRITRAEPYDLYGECTRI